MFSVPLRVPVAEGVNVTLIVQIAPAGTLPPQESCSAKSEAFVPTIATLESVRTVFPVLLKVTLCAALVAPIITVGKVRLLTDRLAIRVGAMPVPVSGTGREPGERSLAITRLAVRAPATVGVNVTLTEQLAPTGRLPAQVSFSAKSEALVPPTVTLVMLSAVDSLFVKTTL